MRAEIFVIVWPLRGKPFSMITTACLVPGLVSGIVSIDLSAAKIVAYLPYALLSLYEAMSILATPPI